MQVSQTTGLRPNSSAASLPTPINSAAGRTAKIVSKLLIFLYSWVLEGRLSGVKTRFLPDGREIPAGSALVRPRLRLLRRQPAIDHEPGPGHESGIVGGEKDDALGDVVGHAEPADRVPRQGELTRRLDIVGAEITGAAEEGLVAHIGLDHSRMDRVDANSITLAGQFEGRRFGKQRDTTLGQRIERVVLRADEPGNRGQIDDGAAMRALMGALAQGRQRVLGAEKHPGQVDRAEPVPFLEARLLSAGAEKEPGLVEQ